MFILHRVTEMVFRVLLVMSLLPVLGILWSVGKLMKSSELFGSLSINLLRWR
ncbi:MAG TPA: hypothetical protein VKI65_18500 [Gemmataceae bacterium]|nr:hypothetical protein [Gemmataceae bacterium]